MSDDKTFLILHGHFYQPPRENPRTGLIEKQPSAAPYRDWNERIYNDCYYANASSRYLDPYGKIEDISNNYKHISFNFGHTLLSWLYEYHRDTHDQIVEADKDSVRRLGHGNAIAQGYNHTILPLDSPRDRKLQILYGIEDFSYRFGRDPEGLWCPECGINGETVDELAAAGIKFVILSPWQCKSVEGEDGTMSDLGPFPAPYSGSYLITGPKGGSVSAFFYHPTLASDISFGHALKSADGLYQNLLSIKNSDRPSLIHTATDGEIYGHHEPYGDMALAALIKKVTERDDFEFTNYGAYLEKHPTKLHAILKDGEEGKGTSWSCSHGVSRWYKDCGCTTGGSAGWNQKWRTPLRESLASLGKRIDAIFDDEIRKIFGSSVDSMEILRKMGAVYSGRCNVESFIKGLHKEHSFPKSADTTLAELISGMQMKLFSFTSCGFFFADVSGLEPGQNIEYALYAIKTYQKYSDEDLLFPFLSKLRAAESNIKGRGNGMTIAQDRLKHISGEAEASIYFLLNRLFAEKEFYAETYGRFTLISYKEKNSTEFEISVRDRTSLTDYVFSILSSSSAPGGINLYICENNSYERSVTQRYRITNNDIPPSILDDARYWVDNATCNIKMDECMEKATHLRHYSMIYDSPIDKPEMKTKWVENFGLCIKILKSVLLLHIDELNWEDANGIISICLDFIARCGRAMDRSEVMASLNHYFKKLADDISKDGLTEANAFCVLEVLQISRKHEYQPEIKPLQNAVFSYWSGQRKASIGKEKLEELASVLNFRI